MNIKATRIKAWELKPGDLFSTAGPDYWDRYNSQDYQRIEYGSIGEKVFIRTQTPATWAEDYDSDLYKIEINSTEDIGSNLGRGNDNNVSSGTGNN